MGEMRETTTPRNLCEIWEISPDTLRMRYAKLRQTNAALFPLPWKIDGELSPEQVELLKQAGERKGGQIQTTEIANRVAFVPMNHDPGRSNEAAPQVVKEKTNWFRLGFRAVCVLIILLHAFLIAYDAATLWGQAGKIGGAAAFLIVLAAILSIADRSDPEVSENMVWLVLLIDAAAFFIHYRTFWYSNRVKGGMDVTQIETYFFSGFICVFSAAAIFFLRQSLVKKDLK